MRVNDPTTTITAAQAVFEPRIQEAYVLAERIAKHLKGYMGVDPKRVTWADAGKAGNVLADLRNICNSLGLPVAMMEGDES